MIPYGRQQIDDDDVAAVLGVLKSDFLTTGPLIEQFEDALSELTSAKYVVCCSSGTSALHLASLALNIGPGDAVVIPSITFLATANSIRYTGAEVVFCDVDPNTGLINTGDIEVAVNRNPKLNIKAVYPVHLNGQCVDLQAIKSFTDTLGAKIVADACHAIGGEANGYPVGACQFEDISTFSFHPVKTVTAGEGGCLMTNQESLAKVAKKLRSHGMEPKPKIGPWAYEMRQLGYNYRMTDIQCALGISQLKKLSKFVSRRNELVKLYEHLLEPVFDRISPIHNVKEFGVARHLFPVLIDFKSSKLSRGALMEKLKEKGVGTQVHYAPVHTQPYYRERYGKLKLPGAETYYSKVLSLPLFPAMTNDDVCFVVQTLREALHV